MQTTQNQKLSLKDRITSKMPGHKNQDKNQNGIPDRLEDNSRTNLGSAHDLKGNGIPNQLETTRYVQPARNLNGIPDSMEGASYASPSHTTDLNRNGIPDQLETSQGFGFVGSVPATSTSVVDVREAPALIDRIEKPAVVHEVYKTEEIVQIQPVIEREREQLDVYEVVQPIREREVVATEIRHAVLPTQTRATIVEDNSAFLAQRSAPSDFSTREVAATRSQTIQNAPIVHETIVHKVIEEIQPVIYKEIDRPVLIKETLPIYEKIVEAPHTHHTIWPVRDLGTSTTVSAPVVAQTTFATTTTTEMTDLNRNGIPDRLESQNVRGNGTYLGLSSNPQASISQYPQRVGLLSQPQIVQSRFSQGQNLPGTQQGFSQGVPAHRTPGDLNGNGIPDRMEKAHGLKDLNRNRIDDSLERMNQAALNPNTRA